MSKKDDKRNLILAEGGRYEHNGVFLEISPGDEGMHCIRVTVDGIGKAFDFFFLPDGVFDGIGTEFLTDPSPKELERERAFMKSSKKKKRRNR